MIHHCFGSFLVGLMSGALVMFTWRAVDFAVEKFRKTKEVQMDTGFESPEAAKEIDLSTVEKYEIHPERLRDLENRFVYHAPKGNQQDRYIRIRTACLELAKIIASNTPHSRDQSSALTHLDSVMFHANAAIARNE